MRFVHTADWQLGKPFAGIRHANKRSLVQQARIEAIGRIGAAAREAGAAFVLVAGDLFDSPSADKATVSAACDAIGRMGVPVVVIPGNHDHGGPGSLWEQEFFLRERAALAPDMRVLLSGEPLELHDAVILPCPLLRRTVSMDPTAWLRAREVYGAFPRGKPRIVLAHGNIQGFGGQWDEEDEDGPTGNFIDIERIPDEEIDYIALGDWHGARQVGPKAWYAGTPELDRFPKGADHDPGNILVVEVARGEAPRVTKVRTARLRWNELAFDLAGDSGLDQLQASLASVLDGPANEHLLRLTLTGSVGIEACSRLEGILESLEARLLHLKLRDETRIAPTEEEIQALARRDADPLISRVARQLAEQAEGEGGDAAVARIALRELYAACVTTDATT